MRAAKLAVAVGTGVLALAGASAATAAPPPLDVTRVESRATTVQPGAVLVATGTLANATRRELAAQVSVTLRPTSGGGVPSPVESATVRVPGTASAAFRVRGKVAPATPPGRYDVVACARRVGAAARTERCATAPRRLRVAALSPPKPLGERLQARVGLDGLIAHARRLQVIAEGAGNNRAAGSEGYGASVQYVAATLEATGYAPRILPFSFTQFAEVSPAALARVSPSPRTFAPDVEATTLEYSGSGSVTARLTPVGVELDPPRANTSGCEAADFAGFPAGDVALLQRGVCTFAVKVANAVAAGAAGVILFNQGDSDDPTRTGLPPVTLGAPVSVPVVGTTYAVGAELAAGATATVSLTTDTVNETRTSANVVADTPGGAADRTVVVGAHLDSVPEGPGINDNGSGVAATLELAKAMAREPAPANRVRFAFWGAEELGLIGSTEYVGALPASELSQLAVNLNFDMLGSPNFARLVYDGDGSDSPDPSIIPPGSAAIEQAFVDHFAARGLASEPTPFDGRSDYGPFIAAGVPAGGLFSGAEGVKTDAQAALFGGTAGLAFDPNYHQAGDTIANLNPTGFVQLADAAADVLGRFADDPALRAPVATASAARAARRGPRLVRSRTARRRLVERRLARNPVRGGRTQR